MYTGPKITRFQDIPQFTSWGGYRVNVGWGFLEQNLELLSNGYGLDLDPDFQRGHVWTEAQQVAYVEYILRGGKAARDLLFNCPDFNRSPTGPVSIVDGKQRLEAVRRFMRDEIRAFGSLRSEFTDSMRLTGPDFVFHVNSLMTRAEVLAWYLDLNTGGTPHTDEEIKRVRLLLASEQAKPSKRRTP